MKTVVCIKQVPDASEVRIDPETNTLVRQGVPTMLNPLDLFAVEGAVRMREQHGGDVIALSMGPPQAEEVVREAIARGCDTGILLSDPAFAGSDTWATSYALACAVRRIGGVELVLCGKQAIDGDTAQVGPGLAAHLGWSQAAYVRRFIEVEGSHMTVERLTDWGSETLKVALPAVMSVLKELDEPRLPSLVSQMQARRCRVEKWGPEQIGADVRSLGLMGSPTRVLRVFAPQSARKGTVWKGDLRDAARKLVGVLRGEGVLK